MSVFVLTIILVTGILLLIKPVLIAVNEFFVKPYLAEDEVEEVDIPIQLNSVQNQKQEETGNTPKLSDEELLKLCKDTVQQYFTHFGILADVDVEIIRHKNGGCGAKLNLAFEPEFLSITENIEFLSHVIIELQENIKQPHTNVWIYQKVRNK